MSVWLRALFSSGSYSARHTRAVTEAELLACGFSITANKMLDVLGAVCINGNVRHEDKDKWNLN
jgi:hypothetical protein